MNNFETKFIRPKKKKETISKKRKQQTKVKVPLFLKFLNNHHLVKRSNMKNMLTTTVWS